MATNDEILRQRAESLAMEQGELVEESRTGILMFELGDETYGVRISAVREIHNEYVVTPIPCVPDFVMGVVNIRGEIVSVTDLRAIMGLGNTEHAPGAEQSPLIVVCDETVCTALLVDSIGDIADLATSAIEPPLAVSDKAQADYIAGTFYLDDRLAAVVNVSRVLTPIMAG